MPDTAQPEVSALEDSPVIADPLPGRVYIYNMTDASASFILNTRDIDSIKGTSASYGWKPYYKAVARTSDERPRHGEFGDYNELRVRFPQSGVETRYQIDLVDYPGTEDFQLLIYYQAAVLSLSGVVVWREFKDQ